eukprot:Colp12_sorted_trinity150504_noHs@18757
MTLGSAIGVGSKRHRHSLVPKQDSEEVCESQYPLWPLVVINYDNSVHATNDSCVDHVLVRVVQSARDRGRVAGAASLLQEIFDGHQDKTNVRELESPEI